MNDWDKTRWAGQMGWYWCNTLYYDLGDGTDPDYVPHYKSDEAASLRLEHTDVDNHLVKSRARRVGLPIRPVYKGEL